MTMTLEQLARANWWTWGIATIAAVMGTHTGSELAWFTSIGFLLATVAYVAAMKATSKEKKDD